MYEKELKEFFNYDMETGVITRREGDGFYIKAGSVVTWQNARGWNMVTMGGRSFKAIDVAYLFVIGHFPLLPLRHANGVKTDDRWSNIEYNKASKRYRRVHGG